MNWTTGAKVGNLEVRAEWAGDHGVEVAPAAAWTAVQAVAVDMNA